MALPQCPQKTLTNQLDFLSKNVLPFLIRHPVAKPFIKPVDYISFGLPEYPNIVKCPIDLSTIKDRLSRKFYSRSKDCIRDLNLMFQNCYLYNCPGDSIVKLGLQLEQELITKLKLMPNDEFKIAKTTKLHAMPLSKSNIPKKIKKLAIKSMPGDANILERTKTSINLKCGMSSSDSDKCLSLLTELMSHKYKLTNYLFLKPVDVRTLGLSNYYDIVKCPIDLGTIKYNLDNGNYDSKVSFINDIYLMVNNCIIYNGVSSDIGMVCKHFQNDFEDLFLLIFKEKCLDNVHDDAFYFLVRIMRRHKEIDEMVRINTEKIANSRHRIDMIVNILEESNMVDKKRRKKEPVE